MSARAVPLLIRWQSGAWAVTGATHDPVRGSGSAHSRLDCPRDQNSEMQ